MSHDQLWAPWRLGYIKGDRPKAESEGSVAALLPGGDAACFLCRAVASDRDRENLVVQRSQHSVTVLNRYPYNNGHLLVAPRLHKARLEELTEHEHLDAMQVVTRMVGVLERLLSSEGFNVGLNLGRVAGAGVPGHLHWHIVPRWSGDTNFMPVLSCVRRDPAVARSALGLVARGVEQAVTSPLTHRELSPALDLPARERVLLAPYAMHSADSAGRKHPEPPHPYRGPFQRDRDRIVHCAAYRRLSHKMQVFTGDLGDYHRTRLTHTIEVASIARTLARALRLNEDLVEALALCTTLGIRRLDTRAKRAG